MQWFMMLLLLPALVGASITPTAAGTRAAVQATSGQIAEQVPLESSTLDPVTAINKARATAAEAATAAGQPGRWLVSFKPIQLEPEVQSTSAALIDLPPVTAASIARKQVYAAVKASVLRAQPVQPTAAAVSMEAGAASTAAQAPGPAVQMVTDYSHLPISYVSISSPEELARIRADPLVASVTANGIVRKMEMAGLSMIGQPAVIERGYVGSGTIVTIDTGLDYTRAAFGPCTAPGVPADTCKVVFAKDIAPEDNSLDDAKEPHGTNVAGIIAAVAPGVKLINLDIFGPNGDAEWTDFLTAMNWAVANKDVYNITVVNLSLGGGSTVGVCDDQALPIAINSAHAQGILSAAAAGNDGRTDALIVPACASKAVSVGAVHTVSGPLMDYGVCVDEATPVVDSVACFSNSAPELKILAPGVSITAAGETMSGTSQATPFVSAALAILRSRYPGYTLDQVVSALTSTGVPITDSRNGLVRPRLNLRAATSISCTPKISPSSLRAPNSGGTFTLTVTPPTSDCTWTVAAPSATWMRIVGPSTGTGAGTITLQVDPAPATARGTGVLVDAADGSSGWSVLVSQAVTAAVDTDVRPPVIGRVKLQTAPSTVTLSWPPARDAQSGVSSYMVVYNVGSTPPRPRCTTGTQVTQTPQLSGSSLQLVLTSLKAGQRYTFRVCPIDATGNVGVGSMSRGTPTR